MKRGDIISGYELVAQIAEGGMGTIWRARHPHLDRQVALKFIRADVRDDSAVRDAFEREVKNLSRLHSPHIVQVTDSGFTHDGSPFMVTEYLDGEDLRTRLERERKLSIRDTLTIAIDVLKALSEAHGIGLVHRDLKPGIFFCSSWLVGKQRPSKYSTLGSRSLWDRATLCWHRPWERKARPDSWLQSKSSATRSRLLRICILSAQRSIEHSQVSMSSAAPLSRYCSATSIRPLCPSGKWIRMLNTMRNSKISSWFASAKTQLKDQRVRQPCKRVLNSLEVESHP